MTGSGKTTLARFLLAGTLPDGTRRNYRVVLDYKGRINWPEYKLYRSLKALVKAKESLLLYRPDYAESMDEDAQSRVWEWIYRRGGTTAYMDELTAVTRGDIYPFHYGSCMVRGREYGIEVWSGTQRPTKIPQVTLSESEHCFVFALRLPQDRERVEAFTGVNRREIADLRKHEFLYSHQDGRRVGPMTLELPSTH